MAEPIIKLEDGGRASIINYNIPEPSSYPGRFFIDLQLKQEYFRPDISGNIPSTMATEALPIRVSDEATLRASIIKGHEDRICG